MRARSWALLLADVVAVALFPLVAIPAEAVGGFYLVAPPASQSGAAGGNAVNVSAPLSRWERLGTFELNADCFAALAGYRNATRNRVQGSSLGREAPYLAALLEQARAEHARCVFANDPRLR